MNLIAAADRHWGIGRGGQLLYHIPADLRRFKALTMGHTLLMGRKTFGSLPGLLPGRAHAVLSRDDSFAPSGAAVVRSLEQALALVHSTEDVFLIGGAQLYAALLEHCSLAYITKIDADGGADAFMPNLDTLLQWQLHEQSPWQEDAGLRFRYCLYQQKKQQG